MTRHIPISEFKDNVSEYVAAAEAGEEIILTRHGKPAARLEAVDPSDAKAIRQRRTREALARLAEIRAEQRTLGMTATIEEMIAWKNEGRR